MNRHLAAILVSFVLVACSNPPDHIGTVLEFQKYKNFGDLDSALALFADEPSLKFGSLGTIKGRTAIRDILEYDVALNTHLQFEDCVSDELDVSCRVIESNAWLRTVGIESITYTENRFSFAADGRIQSVSATLATESEQLLGAAVAEFHQWATVNRPTEYSALFSEDGAFVYSGENAENVLVLLRTWQAE